MPNRKVILPTVAGLVLLAIMWFAFRDDSVEPPAPKAAPAMPAARQAAAASGAIHLASATMVAASTAHENDAACVIKPPPPVVRSADEADPAEESASVAAPPGPLATARAAILARMSASSDPFANAVAAWVDIHPSYPEAELAERMRRLETMASSTQDPRMYELALRTCWRRAVHPCQQLSARRWSELEPDNAAPWMMMLDEAQERQDQSGIQEAMNHAISSSGFVEREYAPLQPILDAASNDPDSLLATRQLAVDAMGIVAAQVGSRALGLCRASARPDANRQQQCAALVDRMEHHADTVWTRTLGANADKRMTGNERLLREIQALASRENQASIWSIAASGCADLRSKLASMRRLAVEGDFAVAQDLAR